MALVHCPECGTEVSDSARTCPKCGYPLKPQVTPNAQPAPTYVQPQPTYVQPQPIYVQQPQPTYAPTTNAGSMGLGFALGFFLSWVGLLIAYLTHAPLTKKGAIRGFITEIILGVIVSVIYFILIYSLGY